MMLSCDMHIYCSIWDVLAKLHTNSMKKYIYTFTLIRKVSSGFLLLEKEKFWLIGDPVIVIVIVIMYLVRFTTKIVLNQKAMSWEAFFWGHLQLTAFSYVKS